MFVVIQMHPWELKLVLVYTFFNLKGIGTAVPVKKSGNGKLLKQKSVLQMSFFFTETFSTAVLYPNGILGAKSVPL